MCRVQFKCEILLRQYPKEVEGVSLTAQCAAGLAGLGGRTEPVPVCLETFLLMIVCCIVRLACSRQVKPQTKAASG